MISTEFLITSLVVVLLPGAGVLYTLSTGLLKGVRAGVFASIGCTMGILPSLLASILGLAVIIHASALAFQLVKYAGVIYLLYLAWTMWRTTGMLNLAGEDARETAFATLMKGFLINILNPKLTLFFLALLPQFIPQQAADPTLTMLMLGGVYMALTFLVFTLYALLADQVRDYVVHSERATRTMQRGFAAGFALLGAKLAFSER